MKRVEVNREIKLEEWDEYLMEVLGGRKERIRRERGRRTMTREGGRGKREGECRDRGR